MRRPYMARRMDSQSRLSRVCGPLFISRLYYRSWRGQQPLHKYLAKLGGLVPGNFPAQQNPALWVILGPETGKAAFRPELDKHLSRRGLDPSAQEISEDVEVGDMRQRGGIGLVAVPPVDRLEQQVGSGKPGAFQPLHILLP